jgi:Protein of unknown function (DUF4231)
MPQGIDVRSRQSPTGYRSRYYVSTVSTVLLSGVITAIAGWKPTLGDRASNVILLLGAISTLVSAWGAFFSPRESWLLYAQTLAKLRALQVRLRFRYPDDSLRAGSEAEVDEFFEKYQAVHDEHNRRWLEVRSSSRGGVQQSPR